MRLTLLITIIAIAGCRQRDHTWSIDPLISPYVESFYSEGRLRGYVLQHDDLIVGFAELRPNENGRCTVGPGLTPLVRISKLVWDNLDVGSREELIYHELGHCLLYRVHTDGVVGNRPVSIMHMYLFSGVLYMADRQAYLDELFSRTSARLAEF